MQPPFRFSNATFENYEAHHPTQAAALRETRRFTASRKAKPSFWKNLLRRLSVGRSDADRSYNGLYLVGPVGTGKTHLLAAMYHALHPTPPCAFMHAGQFFRTRQHPHAFARQIADEYEVFCLDEMEIDDPANEARLVQTLQTLEQEDVTLLATSNMRPEHFLSAEVGNRRFRRFLNETFQQRYKVVPVEGEDYRQRSDGQGHAWIGPPHRTRPVMQHFFEGDEANKAWWSFEELMQAATHTEHGRLVTRLGDQRSLYVADICIEGTDDALRLLRLIDALYLQPDPPRLYFTARRPPESWLDPETTSGLEKGVAEKFRRTTSRLTAFCTIEHLDGP